MNLTSAKTRVYRLSASEEIMTLALLVLIHTTKVWRTDGQMDGQTSLLLQYQRLHSLLCNRAGNKKVGTPYMYNAPMLGMLVFPNLGKRCLYHGRHWWCETGREWFSTRRLYKILRNLL